MVAFAQVQETNEFTEIERQFQTVDVSLFGRFMLSNKREFPCQIVAMSPGSAQLSLHTHLWPVVLNILTPQVPDQLGSVKA